MIIYSYRYIFFSILTVVLASLFIGCTQENNIPTLDVTVEDSTPLPGSTQTLSAVVTDLDTADIVSVIWDISEGTPPAHIGLTIEYTAPEFETVDTIRVEANDQNDGIVTETIIGTDFPLFSNVSCIAYKAALQLRVSKTVSTIMISTPPSNNPLH